MTDYSKWTFRFGKYKGETFGDVLQVDKPYIEWLYSRTDNESMKKALGSLIGCTSSDTIDVDRKTYTKLKADSEWLECLVAAGVNKWGGIEKAEKIRDGL